MSKDEMISAFALAGVSEEYVHELQAMTEEEVRAAYDKFSTN